MLIAAGIFLAASLTDLLDGYLARKRGQITTLGVLLDPVADKLLISSAFISLVSSRLFLPGWSSLSSEESLPSAVFAASPRHKASRSTPPSLGKIKMAAQVAAITLLILGNQYATVPATWRHRALCCRAVCLVVRCRLFPDLLDQD